MGAIGRRACFGMVDFVCVAFTFTEWMHRRRAPRLTSGGDGIRSGKSRSGSGARARRLARARRRSRCPTLELANVPPALVPRRALLRCRARRVGVGRRVELAADRWFDDAPAQGTP